jgi:hypothetical protein
VWGLNKTNTKLVKDQPKWTNVMDHIRIKLAEIISTNNLNAVIAARRSMDVIQSQGLDLAIWTGALGAMTNTVGEFVRCWQQATQVSTAVNINHVRMLCTLINAPLDETTVDYKDDLAGLYESVILTYPLLKLMNAANAGEVKYFVDYVNMIDTLRT